MGGLSAFRALVVAAFVVCLPVLSALAEPLTREDIAPLIVPPMSLGDPLNDNGAWELLNSGGAQAGYVFETGPMAPLPGFSGAVINVMVVLDLDGRYLDARLLSHNEPIFVSGLGEAPFQKFFEQYRGNSISDILVVGTPYGDASDGSALVYLDGVTKATASVRIAHESILAAVNQVAREFMQGVSTGPPAFPDPEYAENLTWEDLVEQGLVTRKVVLNREIDAAFADTVWADDDPDATAAPDEPYLDLWIVDLGPPSIARAVLDDGTLRDLEGFLEISGSDEPILVIETARHGLVSEEFVRNTSPDWLSASQGGLPVSLRDSDLFINLSRDLPRDLRNGNMLILRTDRRLGFDPSQEWTLHVKAIREHGMFRPEIGSVTIDVPHATDARFFVKPEVPTPLPPWLEALNQRAVDMVALAVLLTLMVAALAFATRRLAGLRAFAPLRLAVLGVVVGFVGWWGQGQLSIVTVLGVIRTIWEGGSFAFLLYDPFSLLIWGVSIGALVFWGRGLFCGWLCPFGALQEFAHHIGQVLRLPQIDVPERVDRPLRLLKYGVLAALVALVFTAPGLIDTAAEVEPFKTAITTYFVRAWYYVAYAVGLIVLSMVLFKGFCRYLCPLGAFFAVIGAVRLNNWIPRRVECGSPCQLCKVRCKYGAIEKSGKIQYSECFQCLDCVTIHDSEKMCVPLVLKARGRVLTPDVMEVPAE